MKKLIFISLAAVLFVANAFAQDDKYGPNKAECLKYISYYEEYFKQKAYDDAIPAWREAYKLCPTASRQTILTNGTTLVRRLISKNAKNPEYRQALIDTLFTLHDKRAEFFPKYKVTALNNKGQDIFNYIKNDNEKLLKEYSAIIDANRELTKPTLFVHQFNAATELYKNGKMDGEALINLYQQNNDFLNASDDEDAASARAELEARFIQSGVASCETLLALLGPKFEADPTNVDLAGRIVKMLNVAEDCIKNDLYLKAVTVMHADKPSYNSAYALFRLNSVNDNVDEAIKYIEEAIAFEESDQKTDAEYYFELASFSFKNGRRSLAFSSAVKAAELDQTLAGKSYFLIGNIWGSTTCGGDEIEKRAPYWVAVDYMLKAKAADETLTEEANKYIGMYSKYYPQTADAFMYSLTDGQSYTVSCAGMSATTVVRTQK
ncbi:MAG: hypothetical protein MJY77_09200 [Bacteroidaceae bacterium]|nr:hypothetical protein [Bacteroidaceae bacterium]